MEYYTLQMAVTLPSFLKKFYSLVRVPTNKELGKHVPIMSI